MLHRRNRKERVGSVTEVHHTDTKKTGLKLNPNLFSSFKKERKKYINKGLGLESVCNCNVSFRTDKKIRELPRQTKKGAIRLHNQ